MPSRQPCAPGCTCGHHNRPRKLDWSSREEKNAYLREYRAARREEIRAKAREAYRANRESVRAEQRARYAADPEKYRQAARDYKATKTRDELRSIDQQWRYGLVPGSFEAMLAAQDGRCIYCSKDLDLTRPKSYAIDHDHVCCPGQRSCGACVLGIACARCNLGIGHFDDDPQLMKAVADKRQWLMTSAIIRRVMMPAQFQELPINVVRLDGRKKESA